MTGISGITGHDKPPAAPPPTAPPRMRVHARIRGMGSGLIVGTLLMAAAGTARITLLQIMRRDRRMPQAG